MFRMFDNSNKLSEQVILSRLKADPDTVVILSSNTTLEGMDAFYVSVDSLLSDQEIIAALSTPLLSIEIASLIRKANAFAQAKLVSELKALTPEEAAAYVESSITDLDGAVTVIKAIVRLLIALRDELWPDLPEA